MKNVILIMMDELRKDVAYHQKYPQVSTPNIDRLRAEGITCDNAFVQFPTCVPSRASILTGLYPHQMGIFNHAYTVPESVVTFPERMSARGYDAVAFGKTHYQHKGYRHYPERDGVAGYGTTDVGFPAVKDGVVGVFPGKLEEQHDMAACLQFSEYLSTRDKTKSFVAHMGIMAPHPPLFPPKEFAGCYSPDEIEVPVNEESENASQPRMSRNLGNKRWLIHSDAGRRKIISTYLDMVTYADHCVGVVLKALEENGILEDTIIVVTADHGEMLGEHELIGKWFSLYDDVLRVPLVFRLPGKTYAGEAVPQMVELVDLVPTLLELTDTPLPDPKSEELAGSSIAGLFGDSEKPHCDRIFAMTENVYCVRTDKHKLIIPAGRECMNHARELFSDNEIQLFDLEKDPGEHRNVYRDPAYAGVRAELAESIIQHLIHHHQWLGQKMG